MPFTVVYDACVLYPAPLRDLLLRVAARGLVQARWTDQILDECFDSIRRERKDLRPEALARTRELMNRAVRDCRVTGYEPLIQGITLPDAKDRHVVAAAIKASAQAIITANVRDFPKALLATLDLEAIPPDDFVLDLIDLTPVAIATIVKEQSAALKRPPVSVPDLLSTLETCGLPRSVAKLREMGL